MMETEHACTATCPECGFEPFERNHYFTGKLLVERDFSDEQRYVIDKLRHHNARLHGWGVACGLKVVQHPSEDCRDHAVVIEPGTAIDCCGREILVTRPEVLDLNCFEAFRALAEEDEPQAHVLQICIRYRECPTEEVPVLYDDCTCDESRCAPNRILESFEFDLRVDPDLEDSGEPPLECCERLWESLEGCPPCEDKCVTLATVVSYHAGDALLDPEDPAPSEADDDAAGVARINNRLGRKLLPSVGLLAEIVECLCEHGGGEVGPQGPAGSDGADGADGADGVDGQDGVDGEDGKDGIGLEKDLTQIVGLSWRHADTLAFADQFAEVFLPSGQSTRGLVVGFSRKIDVAKMRGLDKIFQMLVAAQRSAEFDCRCAVRGRVEPVIIEPAELNPHIQKAKVATAADGPNGLALIFPPDTRIGKIIQGGAFTRLPPYLADPCVRLRGDFVIDVEGRAVDAEFVRAQLPTGDRPAPPEEASKYGIQGGLFESWFGVKDVQDQPDDNDGSVGVIVTDDQPANAGTLVDMNSATAAMIESLPGAGSAMADLTMRERRKKKFTSLEDFEERVIGTRYKRYWDSMKPHVTISKKR